MPLVTLSDRDLAEIDRGLDNLIQPGPDQIRSLIREVLESRRTINQMSASHMRTLAALRAVQITAETTLQLEAAR